MLMFLAGVLEQMDLALEHIAKGGVHDARFGLMMTDNAVELILHQIAKKKHVDLQGYARFDRDYQYPKELEEALGRDFGAKLKFARSEGHVSEEQARTIAIMHSFRNEVYHVGVQHEAILPQLSSFYFSIACAVCIGFPVGGYSYSSNMKIPDRAKKYFNARAGFPGTPEDFRKGCQLMADQCGHNKAETIGILADHMESVIEESSTCLNVIADGIYENQHRTRDQAIVDTQIWPLAGSTEAREFAASKGWRGDNLFDLVEWLGKNYTLRIRKDPIPAWGRQAKRLASSGNPHVALANYQSFMTATAKLREALLDDAMQIESEIDRLIDDRRMEGY
jgi:hypothetical protein